MRKSAVAAGGVLVLAIAAWWALRSAPQAAIASAMPKKAVTPAVAKLALPAVAGSAVKSWKQSEQDRAWCLLPGPEFPQDRAVTAEESQRIFDNNAAWTQGRAEIERVHALWAAALRARGDERSRAAADMVDPSEAAKRDLYDLARNTQDPVVYGWAMTACMHRPGCELSASRWVQLDPGNLAPWAMEVQQAGERGDVQAQREAVYQMGLARRNDDYGRALMSLEYTLAQAEQPGLQMGTEVMQPFSDLLERRIPNRSLTDYCSVASANNDASRRSICLGAAEAMWRHADDSMAAAIATGMARRLAGPDDPLWAQRRQELDALRKRLTEHAVRQMESLPQTRDACVQQPEMREYFQKLSAVGELALMRQLPDTLPP